MKQLSISGFFTFLVACFLLVKCAPKKEAATDLDAAAYENEVDTWHKKRVDGLLGPSGWVNVSGLFWLKEGINTFGAGPGNDMVFPEGKIADRGGSFFVKQGIVEMHVAADVDIKVNGKLVTRATLFDSDSSRKAQSGSLEWFIIKRDTKYGIRLRDFSSDALAHFSGIERFDVDIGWKLNARVEETKGRTIAITNVLGQTMDQPAPGTLVFEIEGTEHRLDGLDEGGDDLFIIFGDETNAKETYGAGRYLYVKKPDQLGMTVIDFNKAYNPPCAFTAFATCPLPPRQNILPIPIRAGEKNYGIH
ncbi:MAG: DUF1684 domain-containing protein [Cytophagales bacterium]|nr:DUF1684 domain-containing protein [Cytophagales bacterium]